MSPQEPLLPYQSPIDLSNCEREPIHIPGHVQSHGSLLALDAKSNEVVMFSSNVEDHFERAMRLGTHVRDCFSAEVAAVFEGFAINPSVAENPQLVYSGSLGSSQRFDVTGHLRDGLLILESEHRIPTPTDLDPLTATHGILRRLQTKSRLVDYCQALADELRTLCGYDRVMVYRFAPDFHGWVYSESMTAGLDPFLNLHYPASDIPAQARALFLSNRIRMLVDARYKRIPLTPEILPSGNPLDMTNTFLRGASEMYTEYLNNMGVRATLTLALPRTDKLWGLVACHHYDGPRHISFAIRSACELICQTAALRIGEIIALDQSASERTMEDKRSVIVSELAQRDDLSEALLNSGEVLYSLFGATGLSIWIPGRPRHYGEVPPDEFINKILEALDERRAEVTSSAQLGQLLPAASAHSDTAAGLLAIPIAHSDGAWLFWFRAEHKRSVSWAGDPHKPVEIGSIGDRLTPRKSFELWSQLVEGQADPWSSSELAIASRLRVALSDVLFRERARLKKIALELQQRNEEINQFSSMASHDLREPLRGIANYVAFLREDIGHNLDKESSGHLRRIDALSSRMYALIEGLLVFSRLGNTPLTLEPVDINDAIENASELLSAQIDESGAEIVIVDELPAVKAWQLGISEIFANLIGNSIKYASSSPPRIEIGLREGRVDRYGVGSDAIVVYLRDNGIGIATEHHESVFRIYHRLKPDGTNGSGMGLAIVRKIIERLGGAAWIEPTPSGEGTTMFLAFARTEDDRSD